MKTYIMSITTAFALLIASASKAQINLGATTSATVQSATRVSTGGALQATGSHVKAATQNTVNATKNMTAKTTTGVKHTVSKTTTTASNTVKNSSVQAGAGIDAQSSTQSKVGIVNSDGHASVNAGAPAEMKVKSAAAAKSGS